MAGVPPFRLDVLNQVSDYFMIDRHEATEYYRGRVLVANGMRDMGVEDGAEDDGMGEGGDDQGMGGFIIV